LQTPTCPLPIPELYFILKDIFCSRNLKNITRVKEIQFVEEELSGGKWALTDRWTLATGQAETKRGSVWI